ncbi:hypothetical protein ACWEPL_31025 [Nonomuraea sp. NPDC004186]
MRDSQPTTVRGLLARAQEAAGIQPVSAPPEWPGSAREGVRARWIQRVTLVGQASTARTPFPAEHTADLTSS